MLCGRMAGRTKRWGRCPCPGHGAYCEVTREIRAEPVGRAAERRAWKRVVELELAARYAGVQTGADRCGEALGVGAWVEACEADQVLLEVPEVDGDLETR